MKNSTLRFILLLSLLLNVSVLATGGYLYYRNSGERISPFAPGRQSGGHLFEELSLTQEQGRAVRAKAAPFHAEMEANKSAIARKRRELMALMRAPAPDRRAIEALLADICGMQREAEGMIVAHILEIRSLLDGERQGKFLALIENAMGGEPQRPCHP